ncbi:MAG: hypothetical protein ACI4XG_08575, partial [Bradyrhizobium sp.]
MLGALRISRRGFISKAIPVSFALQAPPSWVVDSRRLSVSVGGGTIRPAPIEASVSCEACASLSRMDAYAKFHAATHWRGANRKVA